MGSTRGAHVKRGEDKQDIVPLDLLDLLDLSDLRSWKTYHVPGMSRNVWVKRLPGTLVRYIIWLLLRKSFTIKLPGKRTFLIG